MTTTKAISEKTPADLKAWATTNRNLALAVVEARAFAAAEKARVAAYILPVFAEYVFTNDDDGHGDGSRITDPERLYLSDDEGTLAAYYAACDVSHARNGYEGADGRCPALIAEGLSHVAEDALTASMLAFMGITRPVFNMEHRASILARALDCCLLELV